jgi:2-phosphosulfolactate phosphatase
MTEHAQIFLSRGVEGCALAVHQAGMAIVVDALRASTTLALLCDRGAGRIQVIARVEDALALARITPNALLVGERGGERIPGFQLGNSPHEVLASPPLAGRTVIFTSSNGAQRLAACQGAAVTLVGSTANATAVAEWTRAHAESSGRSVVCIAAGKYPDEGFVSPEDEATCAYLSMRIGLPIADESLPTFQQWEHTVVLEGLESIFRHSKHAQRLMEIGYGDDVIFCARPDTSKALPMVTGSVLLENAQIGVEVRDQR